MKKRSNAPELLIGTPCKLSRGWSNRVYERYVEEVLFRNALEPGLQEGRRQARPFLLDFSRAGTAPRRALNHLAAQRGNGLVLLGNRGTGKTTLAAALACMGLVAHGWETSPAEGSYYRDLAELLEAEKRRFGNRDLQTETRSPVEEAIEAPMLVLDEVQETVESEWRNSMVRYIISRRYDYIRPTIIIANCKVEDLSHILGESAVSRIEETSLVMECNWRSYRQDLADGEKL